MPIKVQNNLPAKKIMEQENIFMMDETRATTQKSVHCILLFSI